MKKVLIVYYAEMINSYKLILDILRMEWKKKEMDIIDMAISDLSSIPENNKEYVFPDCDYICSIDLAGFQYGTVLENGCQYNKHPAIQMHIVTNSIIFSTLRKIETALNLFIFVPETDVEYVNKQWNISNLIPYKGFNADNSFLEKMKVQNTIVEMIDYILREEQPDLY